MVRIASRDGKLTYMWIELDKELKNKVLALRDADKLLAYGKLLYHGDESTPRDLDLAVECFIRAAECGKKEAIHYLYFINDANAANEVDRGRVNAILAKCNLYNCTLRMLAVQTEKDLHQLMLNDSINSQYWQQGLEHLIFAAKRNDAFAKWELALHYMVGRGCEQDCELAKKYANSAYKASPFLRGFIPEYVFMEKIPSLEEVASTPKKFCNDIDTCRQSFAILYPEIIKTGSLLPLIVDSWADFREIALNMSAVWPEFYQIFNWNEGHPLYDRRLPSYLLKQRPQFAELIPINWSNAKQNDIYLVVKYQKFERYIKPEQFTVADFRKVLHHRPEYARFADMQNITERQLFNCISRKAELHELPPEERLLQLIFEGKDYPKDKIVKWMGSIEKYSNIPNLFKNKMKPKDIERFQNRTWRTHETDE